jgi:hypothetical protein
VVGGEKVCCHMIFHVVSERTKFRPARDSNSCPPDQE